MQYYVSLCMLLVYIHVHWLNWSTVYDELVPAHSVKRFRPKEEEEEQEEEEDEGEGEEE